MAQDLVIQGPALFLAMAKRSVDLPGAHSDARKRPERIELRLQMEQSSLQEAWPKP